MEMVMQEVFVVEEMMNMVMKMMVVFVVEGMKLVWIVVMEWDMNHGEDCPGVDDDQENQTV